MTSRNRAIPNRVGFLVMNKDSLTTEERSAWEWLRNDRPESALVPFEAIRNKSADLDSFKALWWHHDSSLEMPGAVKHPSVVDPILNYVNKGGGIVLSLLAAQYVCDLGIESTRPNMIRKGSWDQESWIRDYPDIRGFGSKQGHPLFNGLGGAVFTWNPKKETAYTGAFYSSPAVPREGNIVAVERQYIKLNEDWRLSSEYSVGKGTLVAIGSHFFFINPKDRFRLHLEKLASNCLGYVANPGRTAERKTFWSFGAREVIPLQRDPGPPIQNNTREIQTVKSGLAVTREAEVVRNAFFDVGGRRMLIMGKEQAGIQEVWCHPFRCLKNMRVGFSIGTGDTMWLDELKPTVTIRPESVTRVYSVGELRLEENIVASVDKPGGVVSYHIDSNHPLELVVSGSIDLRIMWPHSEQATGSLTYAWDGGLQAYVVSNDSRSLASLVGVRGTLRDVQAGKFSGFAPEGTSLKGIPTEQVELGFGFRVSVQERSAEVAIIVSGSEDEAEAVRTYRELAADPGRCASDQGKYFRGLFASKTAIESPDRVFNDGYRWALAATDRFLLETPALGLSLVAGIGTTERGWDGGQKISGRPGYAWYFGRDACWTAFALLAYGDHENVRKVLKFLGDHQDLNGKILHELTTSGHVHYDAADSTPLYIMLMGRYLRASGDAGFIRAEFPRLQKAMEFCFSTDTDGDHLIENTNVGHGWVEGGKLFPVHVELYLAACWASALWEASGVAEVLGMQSLSEQWKSESALVHKSINERFWNEQTRFYNFALRSDGSFNSEKTVLPAVAVLLGFADPQKAGHCLDEYASSDFSADWGVRIIGKNNPMFSPQGYHYGSVWPLFTGWTALAEFASGRYVQGFAHTMSTMMIFRHWAAGYVEEVLHGETFTQGGVCSHQAWSESMVLQPLLDGMLGLEYFSPSRTFAFRPWFPPQWEEATVHAIRVGGAVVAFRMVRERNKTTYTLRSSSATTITVNFQPRLLRGTKINRIVIQEGISQREIPVPDSRALPPLSLQLAVDVTVKIMHEGGIGIVVPPVHLQEDKESTGLRVLSEEYAGREYRVMIEGRSDRTFSMELVDPDRIVTGVAGATLEANSRGVPVVTGAFDGTGSGPYRVKHITIHLQK